MTVDEKLDLIIKLLQAKPTSSSEVAGDALLAKFATETVKKKLPSNWKHRDITGELYSGLEKEIALDLAGYFQWCADKGKAETPVRLKDNGKPWWETDELHAKVLRGFAAKATTAPTTAPVGNGDAEPPPF